ncbi:flagellar motor protein MotB [Geomesophilobacter sediminis]|uniref:OmpA family protein n=1 Tax=Geomesophilobacter sediminis TaxID=2798584 RepID=A0A8J7LWB1_9BACT|nr:flagellar motor protein MotB [Geomesophilobacter sediminis]MBJ6725545.1 OmpA family protein [Geomesophilobacter sediminis]
MARRKEPEKPANHERWLVSYGDLLTLLFAVFVTLYAMSQADLKKTEEVSASMRRSFGLMDSKGAAPRLAVIDVGRSGVIPEMTVTPPPVRSPSRMPATGRLKAGPEEFRAMKASLDAYLIRSRNQGKVAVALSERGLVITLKEAGIFESGRAELTPESAELVGTVAELLNKVSNRCRVEGHTDNQPIHNSRFSSNWDLSTARATWLVKLLTGRYDIEAARISATGYGEFQPAASNDTEDGRARNRRVDVVLLSSESEAAEARSQVR